MKRSKRKSDSCSHVESEKAKESSISRKTREKYHKEIVESKETRRNKTREVQSVSDLCKPGDDSIKKDEVSNLNRPDEEDITNEEENDDNSKFSELRKYLLSDLSGKNVKNSSPVKKEVVSEKSKSLKKETMLDTIDESNQTPKKHARSAKSNSVEKANKKSPSKKLSSSVVKSETNSMETLGNAKQKSPRKRLKQTPSPERLSVVTPESPRIGSRQRSPNLRYADDMVMFPLKSPTKRQNLKKENSTPENVNNNDAAPPKTSQSTECQTSQLYSLLTGTVKKVSVQKQASPKNSRSKESDKLAENKITLKMESDEKSNVNIKKDTDIDNVVAKNENEPCEPSDGNLDGENAVTTEVSGNLSHEQIRKEVDEISEEKTVNVSEERGEQKDSNKPASSKLSDTDKKETDMDFLNNLTEVIDQIRVESTQEEMPEWAVYKSKPPKIRRVRKRKPLGQMTQFKVKTALHELQHDSKGGGDIGYTVIEKPLGTPMSSGDEDDIKGKRRTTKPISKRSIIRMSPALGLLVGHDEDGFTMLNDKKTMLDSEDNAKDGVADEKPKLKSKPDDKKQRKNSKVKKEMNNVDRKPAVSKSTVKSVSCGLTSPTQSVASVSMTTATQSQLKVLGNAGLIGTKATIVSGSQTLPCVLVSSASTLKPQTLLNLPLQSINSQGSFIIPANRISLIGSVSTKASPLTVVSPPTTVMSPIMPVNIPLSTSVRPSAIQMVTPVQQPISVLRAPKLKAGPVPESSFFRLSSDGQLISSVKPLASTTARPGTTNQVSGAFVSTTSGVGVVSSGKAIISNPASINLPLKSKVLILKKADIPCSAGQIIVSSPSTSGIRPGMSLLRKLPVTTSSSTQSTQGSIVATSKAEKIEDKKIESVKKSVDVEEQEQQALIPLNNLISKVKTNMNSLMELPECLVTKTFMDSIMINEEYESESESDSEEEIAGEKGDIVMETDMKDSSSDVTVGDTHSLTAEPEEVTSKNEKTGTIYDESPSNKAEEMESQDELVNNEKSDQEKDETQQKDCHNELKSSEYIEGDKIKSTDDVQIDSSETKIENQEALPKSGKEESDDKNTDVVKEPNISLLENKLKKAMESLSVLAAKTESSKLVKHDSKTESRSPKGKEHVICEKVNSVGNETELDDLKGTSPNNKVVSDQGGKVVPMECESLCGSNSESEESGKRRNIFDVIMKDYQSPGKEGQVSDKDEEKSIVEIQDSPKKKSDNVVQDGLKKKSDRTLFDIGLTPKPMTETDEAGMISEENRGNEMSKDADKMSVDNNMTDDKEVFCQVDNSLQHLERVIPNRSNKSEIEEEISDENIKVQQKDELNAEDISSPKILTMADKLLAKFKEINDESESQTCKTPEKLESNIKIVVVKSPVKLESGVKTPTRSPVKIEKIGNKSPFSKPPIKLKICSSPDKSFTKCIVATSDVSNNTSTTRPVPKMSTQQEIKKPLPMNILTKLEQEVKDKLSAFSSPALEIFLQKQAEIDNEADGEEDDDDEEEDENINEIDYDDDSDVSMDEHEPDFDEIDGVLFMSFPSKNALKAHVQVERRTKLGTDENLLLGMTRMRNMRRKQGYIMSKYNKKVGNKFFKDQDNINQNLRGMHKTLAKYQRLYKQELYWLQNPDDDATMSKTNDITKIKGWKNKVGNVTDDVELAKAEIENGGKLHWRTEARLAKNLRPDELKEYGLNIKKKRRKNMIYTQRKGMSKGDRSQRAENDPDELDDSRSNSNDFDEHVEYIDDENEPKDNQEGLPETVDIEGVVVFDPDDDVQDEELIKINERELLKENETRKNTERHRMFIKAQMLKKRLGYNLRDIQVIRKLGGHNIRRRKNAGGIYEGDYIVMDNSSRPSTPDPSQSEETEKETPQKKNRKPKIELHMTVLTSNMISATCTALPKQFIRKKPSRPHVKETDTPTKSPEPVQSTTCDKPDTEMAKNRSCRYSCICHLCVFTEQSPEADDKTVKCEKEYCRLGCICDSIEARKERDKKSHCGKPECIMECECAYQNTKRAKKDDEDYHFKKNSKFATLPRRESTYRLAKNLDAVSRKAMLLYESSEMFAEQKVKRRKSKETTTTTEPAPQVYIDVDYDDFEMDHRLSTVPSKSRKQEFSPQINLPLSLPLKPVPVPHKPVEIKPKPLQHSSSTKNKTEMTDFSNIKSEISSQGSWNLSDLSDEYEDIDVISDKDSEFTTCARTTLYKAVKRDHHLAGCVCNCGRKSDNLDGLGCNADAKFNIPDDILSSGKWHTQWICLRSKGQSLEEADRGGLRLLEVISNCNYEDSKTRILSRLTSHISKETYPILKSFIIGEFQVTFLPRSDKPALIPPEVKAKLPNSVFSIRIQIVKDPGASSESPKVVINLVCDENDKEQLPEKQKKIYDKNGKDQLPEKQKKIKQVTNLVNPGTSVGQSELAKHLISTEKFMESVPSTSSCSSIVPGSISGLSRLQITRPSAPLMVVPVIGNQSIISSSGINVHHSEPKPGNHINSTALPHLNQLGGQVVDTITSSQPINILTSGITTVTTVTSTDKFQTLSECIPKGISMQAPQNTLINTVLKPSSQSVPISSYSVLGTYSNLEIARNKLSDIVKNNMVQPNIGQDDPHNLKRKISEELLVPDPKKSKIENVPSPIQSVHGSNIVHAPPVPSVNKDSDNSIGQISVLRCVRCNVILTAEDITSWVLSQESVQEKICVKCRISKTQITNIQVKLASTTQCTSSSPPVVIDVDEPATSTDHVKKSELETVKKDCVKTSGDKTKTMHYFTEQVEEYSLQIDCEDGESLEIVPNKKSTESKEVKASLKQVIDLDSDNECIAENSKPSKTSLKPTIDLDNDNKCIAENYKPSKASLKPTIGLDNGNECIAENSKPSKRKYDEVTKVVESIPGSASEIEQEDELEAAIRDAQDDYDNIMRNLSDGNESQESDDQNDLTSTKRNVIVIDDDDDDDDDHVDVLKRKNDKIKSDEPVAKRSNMQSSNDEEDVDVLTFSEHDVVDVSSFVGSNTTISPWHNSSCSVHNNLLRKKRKVQHDVIEQNIGEMDVKEGTTVDYEARKKEYLKQKKIKARKMRTEMQQIYNEISEIVMTEKELSTVSKNWNSSSTQPKILDKAVRYIRTEVPRITKLQAKIMAFQQYQVKLKQRLNELKEYHTERGISKDKLNFQLEKIAVVCDRIYEHLPEIKQHIKNKKEGQELTPTSSPAIPPAKTGKPSKQTKKSKSATSQKHQSAEIYIDNPEEYNDEAQINQSATPLVSLPGNYVNVAPGQIQMVSVSQKGQVQMVSASQMTNLPIKPAPVLSLSGSSSIQPISVVSQQGTSVAGRQMPGLQGPNTRLSGTTGTLGLPGPNIGIPNVRISFPLSNNILASNTNTLNMAPINMDGVQSMTKLSETINYTIPVRSPGNHVPIATVQGGHIQPNILQPLAPKSNVPTDVNLPPTSFRPVANSPDMVIQNAALYPPTSVQTSTPELSNILNTPPGQNLGQHPSTSAFSEVIGQMIKKNIVEHSSLNDASTENTQTFPDSQNKNKFSEGYMPPIPQYDVNLLKDQILDDATGELVSVVINDEETENQVNENSKDSSQSSSKNSHISSKGEENGQHSTESKDKSTDSSDVEEKDENGKHEEETNIESLLDDIKSLSGETSLSESPKQKINSDEKCNKSDDIKSLNTNSIVPNQSLSNDDKTDQVDGDLYNFTSGKDVGSLSESDSNNSSRTNPYMEDSDGNISIAGDTNELADSESNVPKIVSVMSIADVLDGDFKSIEDSASTS